MRILLAFTAAIVVMLGANLHAPRANAQSFLQSLFGLGQGSSSGPQPGFVAPSSRMPMPNSIPPGRGFSRMSPYMPQSRSEAREDDMAPESGRGRFRTVCVRACDGYYFPISHATSRNGFYRDSRKCMASCGETAKLYYHAADNPEAEELVDLQGRPYAKLPTAFLYRKTLVAGCSCKPMPWSEAELMRHEQYATDEAMKLAKVEMDATAVVALLPNDVRVGGLNAPATSSDSGAEQTVGEAVTTSGTVPDQSDTTRDVIASEATAHRPPMAAEPARLPRTVRLPKPSRPPAQRVTPVASTGSFSFFGGGGQGKYVWPGDPPPVRTR